MTKLSAQTVTEAELGGWVYLLGGLQTRLRTGDFAAGLALVAAIGAAAEQADHHPDIDLRYTYVDLRLTTHDAGGVTGKDIDLARTITDLATAAGVTLEAAGLSRLELGLDSPAQEKIRPFWAALLDMRFAGDDLSDPADNLPRIWFQKSGSDEPRQRWHPDLWIDPAEVQPRIAAAVAAGGTLVTAAYAPSFWVLADPDGNRVCLCTWQNRASES
jgi:4a-hydroxytetrahydrobiopterin dehydratase